MKFPVMIMALLSVWTACALEVLFFPTLAVNTDDQLNYVMPHRGIYVPLVSRVEVGQPLKLTVSVAGKEKFAEPLKLTATLISKAPDGKEKTAFKDVPFFDIPAGAQGILSPGKYIGGVFEKGDPPGKYTYTLILKDAGEKSYRAECSLELVPQISDDKAMDAAEFRKFFSSYYRNPRPDRIFAAWNYYLGEGVAIQRKKEGKNFNPMAVLKGFCELFRINPQFHSRLAAMSREVPSGKYGYYAIVFGGLGKEFLEKYSKSINPEILKIVAGFKGRDPLAFKDVVHASQLDVLWVEFFITGKFEPVRRLTDQLRKQPVFSIEEAKKRQAEKKPLSAKEQKELLNGLIQMADVWSLKSNLKQHQLLGFYLETVLARKLYADVQTAATVAAILKDYNSKKKENK